MRGRLNDVWNGREENEAREEDGGKRAVAIKRDGDRNCLGRRARGSPVTENADLLLLCPPSSLTGAGVG